MVTDGSPMVVDGSPVVAAYLFEGWEGFGLQKPKLAPGMCGMLTCLNGKRLVCLSCTSPAEQNVCICCASNIPTACRRGRNAVMSEEKKKNRIQREEKKSDKKRDRKKNKTKRRHYNKQRRKNASAIYSVRQFDYTMILRSMIILPVESYCRREAARVE